MALILVFSGLTASGKSTLAQACARRWQAPHYNTDRMRKELVGLAATTPCPDAPGQGIYSRQLSVQTYECLLQRAEEALRSGENRLVVLDGSYGSRAERERVRRLAEKLGVEACFLYCWCSERETRRRLQRRSRDPQSVSDGRWEIYLHQLESFELPLATETDILSLNTEASVETLLAQLSHIFMPAAGHPPGQGSCTVHEPAVKRIHFLYWGKRFRGESGHWHHLCHHCLDTAAVTQALLQKNPLWQALVQKLSPYSPAQTEALLLFLAACHDLGKFGDAFQFCLPPETIWTPSLQRSRPICLPSTQHHTELGLSIWEELCPQDFLPLPDAYVLKPLLTAALAHHGQPLAASQGARLEPQVKEDVQAYLQEVAELFALTPFPEADDHALNRLSHMAAGLFILADWVASNERWFGPDCHWLDARTYFPKAQRQAAQALDDLPFLKEAAPGSAEDFHTLLPHLSGCVPSAMQQAILDLPQPEGPELLIVEDLTGGGKTEAALLAARRFLHGGQGRGLYVGLPTMATADAMYIRLAGSYPTLFAGPVSLILAHGATALNEDFQDSIMPDAGDDGDREAGGARCAQWLADNRKKALLSPCGVGTIDQALLAVLKTRHQALRLFGLCRSVFIGDEVHAFDEYTGTLLKHLLTFHAAMGGGSIVLLSATLPHKLRQTFVDAWRAGRAQFGEKALAAPLKSTGFPLLTRVTDKDTWELELRNPDCAGQGLRRKEDVQVRLVHEEGDMYAALQTAAKAGACACWVRNTVGDVREAFQKLTGAYGVPTDKVLVFHARFAGLDRQRIEAEVLRRFGKNDVALPRSGHILLASQVVEQSLDLDFDLLLSDLAPMDLLIQRAGRCHRHHGRPRPEGYASPLMLVLTPEPIPGATANWYAKMFPAAQYVYPRHALLWRTARLLELEGRLHLPERARFLIEGAGRNGEAFADGPPVVAPATLDDREDCADGKDYARRSEANFNKLELDAGYLPDNLWGDDLRAPTRLGEEMQNLRLLRQSEDGLQLWADGQGHGPMQACLLSEVRVLKRTLSEAIHPPECQQALVALQQAMPDRSRWSLCLVLREESGIWLGKGKRGDGQEVTVRYSPEFGLDVS